MKRIRQGSAVLAAALALLLACAGARAGDYRDDARTARAVSFQSPRAALRECARALSQATGVGLTVSPALGEEHLTGYVPKRPLRETMDALGELYDGVWTLVPGSPPSYRLDPEETKARAQTAARTALLKRYQKAIDEMAAEARTELKDFKPGAESSTQREMELLALSLWSFLPPADRERVLRGATVTFSIPEPQARPMLPLMLSISRRSVPVKEDLKLTGPVLASMTIDDRGEKSGFPAVHARATGPRENSILAAIGLIDLLRLQPQPKAPDPPAVSADDPLLPADAGENGRLTGTRDEILQKIGEDFGAPVLSRHRASSGTAPGLVVGGRRISQVMAEFAASADAAARLNARGFYLVRSLTELLDTLQLPSPGVVERYLKTRPPVGQKVRLAQLAELAALSPMQLAILERGNLCSEDAGFARRTYAVLAFYRALTPAQRQALTSEAGVEAGTLTPPQLHALLNEKAKRGEFNIFGQLQEIKGLRFRFLEHPERREDSLQLQALRAGGVVSSAAVSLPAVAAERGPTAR